MPLWIKHDPQRRLTENPAPRLQLPCPTHPTDVTLGSVLGSTSSSASARSSLPDGPTDHVADEDRHDPDLEIGDRDDGVLHDDTGERCADTQRRRQNKRLPPARNSNLRGHRIAAVFARGVSVDVIVLGENRRRAAGACDSGTLGALLLGRC